MKQLFLSLLMALLPFEAMADAVEIDGIYYNLVSKTKTAEVTGRPLGYTGSITIPESFTYDGSNYSVTSIGDYAFEGDYGLTSIHIPNSVNHIGNEAFRNCRGLTKVSIANIEAFCRISFSGPLSNPLNYAHHLFLNEVEIKDLVIPESISKIREYAFYGCSSLTSLTIPNSVITIGRSAFSSCSGLTSLTIPNSVISIGIYAFNGCSGLTSVDLPNSVTSLDNVFYDCSGLTSLTIPNSVTSINDFDGCSGLTSVTIPNSVTSIDGFQRCSGLTSVTIPNSVTYIAGFIGCSKLISITIGSGIKSIGSRAFSNSPEIKDVYCYAEAVPMTGVPYSFEGSYIEYATLHVPTASINAYKQAEPWKNFKTIVGLDGTAPETQKCAKPSITYQNGQLKMACATDGVQFVTEITDSDIKKHYDATIQLTATYTVNVYATKTGYDNSDVATVTLCWIDQAPSITAGVVQVPAQAVLIQSEDGVITVDGVEEGTQIGVYSINGVLAGSTISHNGQAMINTNLQPGSTAIVKIGTKSIKIAIK